MPTVDSAVRIRGANLEDVPRLVALKRLVASRAYAALPTKALETWQERFSTAEYFDQRITDRNRRTVFFVALDDDDSLLGLVSMKERNHRAYLGDLYVVAQGRGVARALVDQAFEQARRWGLTSVATDVFESNSLAMAFVTRLGFREETEYREQSLGVRVHRLSRPV